MNIFVCLDNQNGLLFNKRRQSMDKKVRQKMLELTNGAPLWMNAYSFGQFEELPAQISVDEQFLEKMSAQEFCFVETCAFPFAPVSTIYIFRWNRTYPADLKLDLSFLQKYFTLVSTEDFPGSSHEKITLEIYRRNES